MEKVHVKGKKAGDIMLYALSTCVWCARVRRLLEKAGVDYSYVYVDLENRDEQMDIEEDLKECDPDVIYPTVFINGKCLSGYNPAELRKRLEAGK